MISTAEDFGSTLAAARDTLRLGRYAEAERLLRQAVGIAARAPVGDAELSAALTELAGLRRDMNDPQEAEALFQRALDLLDTATDADDTVLMAALSGLGGMLAWRSENARAEALFVRALAIGERSLTVEHADLGVLLHNLAQLHLRNAAYTDAEPLLRRLYEMRFLTRGEQHPDTATALANLASLQQALGRHDDGESMWRQVIAVRERCLGPNHFATAIAVERLAESCAARGKVREAVQLLTGLAATKSAAATVPGDGAEESEAFVSVRGGNSRRQPEEPLVVESLGVVDLPVQKVPASPPSAAVAAADMAPITVPALDALLAIQAELWAAGDGDGHEKRPAFTRWVVSAWRRHPRRARAMLGGGVTVLLLLGGLTIRSSARAHRETPTWEVWAAPLSLTVLPDSTGPTDSTARGGSAAVTATLRAPFVEAGEVLPQLPLPRGKAGALRAQRRRTIAPPIVPAALDTVNIDGPNAREAETTTSGYKIRLAGEPPAHTQPAHTQPAHTQPAHSQPAHTRPVASPR